MIAILENVYIDADEGDDEGMRQRVTIVLRNAGAFMPTDELQCMVGSIVRVDVAPSPAAAAHLPMLDNPGSE